MLVGRFPPLLNKVLPSWLLAYHLHRAFDSQQIAETMAKESKKRNGGHKTNYEAGEEAPN